jgi:hypothetical protein
VVLKWKNDFCSAKIVPIAADAEFAESNWLRKRLKETLRKVAVASENLSRECCSSEVLKDVCSEFAEMGSRINDLPPVQPNLQNKQYHPFPIFPS